MPLALRGITSFVGSFFRCSVAVFCLSVTRRVSEEPEKQSTLIDEFTLLEEVEVQVYFLTETTSCFTS